jgi:hypothetical protein
MRRMFFTLFFLLLLFAAPAGQAQEGSWQAPLIAYFNNQLYSMQDDALQPYTACSISEQIFAELLQSPDGSKFVMLGMPRIIQEAIAQLGGIGDFPFAANIWLCDVQASTLSRIYTQPGYDDPFTGDLPAVNEIISRPVWSPDGTQMAWSKLVYPDERYAVVIYDLASTSMQETQVDLPPSFGIPAPPDIAWTDAGILLNVYGFNEVTFLNEETIYIFDPAQNSIINQYVLNAVGEVDDFIMRRLLIDNGTRFALRYASAGWKVVDVLTGASDPELSGVPLLSAAGAANGYTLLFDMDESYNDNWQIVGATDEAGRARVLAGYPARRIAVAPDGSAVAYADSTLKLLRDNIIVEVANSDGFADDVAAQVIWGVPAWSFSGEATVAEAAPTICEGTQVSRLQRDQLARVLTPTIPNNVRDNPSVSGTLVGQIPGGESFVVLAGPVCADGYAWFQVDFNGLVGWTVEGSATAYFLEPVNP